MPAPADAYQRAEFTLHGDHRFKVHFELKGHRATLIAERFHARPKKSLYAGVGAGYFSRGSFGHDRVRARFGGRGKINVKFEQAGATVRRDPPPRCEGRPKTVRRGFFIGTIRFHGERGYTAVDVDRARGKLRTVPSWKCPRLGSASRGARSSAWEEGRPAVLEAKKGKRGGRTLFEVAADRYPDEGDEGLTRFTAARVERRSTMLIYRLAWAFGKDETFVCDEALTWATAKPPPPFAGSATFLRGAQGPVWTGSLSVELPGVGSVSLAGEDYSARLYWGKPDQAPGY